MVLDASGNAHTIANTLGSEVMIPKQTFELINASHLHRPPPTPHHTVSFSPAKQFPNLSLPYNLELYPEAASNIDSQDHRRRMSCPEVVTPSLARWRGDGGVVQAAGP